MHTLKKIYRALIAVSLSVMIVFGTTGFAAEKHLCEHSGDDFSISLFSLENGTDAFCCETPAPLGNVPGHCDMNSTSCCSYETESIVINDQFVASHYIEDIGPFYIEIKSVSDQTKGIESKSNEVPIPPDRIEGRQIIILHSQFRT